MTPPSPRARPDQSAGDETTNPARYGGEKTVNSQSSSRSVRSDSTTSQWTGSWVVPPRYTIPGTFQAPSVVVRDCYHENPDREGLTKVTEHVDIPVGPGERTHDDEAMDELIRKQTCDIVHPDVCDAGASRTSSTRPQLPGPATRRTRPRRQFRRGRRTGLSGRTGVTQSLSDTEGALARSLGSSTRAEATRSLGLR